MSLVIKICGLSTPETLDAALDAGADMVGFVFFPPSPRSLSPERAGALGQHMDARAGQKAQRVALTVNADDEAHEAIIAALRPHMLQLHGKETPERVREVRARFGLPVMKALHIAAADDLAQVARYDGVADRLLFDAKPPQGATLPGGNGAAFDWTLLRGLTTRSPWMLSGGLDLDNVAQALAVTAAPGIDVSSGVETAPGVKSIERISAFVALARQAKP